MKELKPILLLVGKFLLTYLVLTILYSLYLDNYLEIQKIADPFTRWVSDSVEWGMDGLGFDTTVYQVENESFCRFYIEGTYASRINEGCNAISVMIIFVSFVIAFSKGFIKTTLFVLLGLVLLHITNLIRVGWLNYIFVYQQDWSKTVHDYIFPAIIYGMVLLLWLIWVKYFIFKPDEK